MDFVTIIELTAVGFIFLCGLICNTIVIRSIMLSRRNRAASTYNKRNECLNLLVMNLAITDLLILLVSIPLDVIPEHISWPFGTFVCKFFTPLQDICLTSSTLTFTVIAVERYLVSKGVTHRGARNAKVMIGGIWLVSSLTMGLPLSIYKTLINDEGRIECDVVWPNETVARFFLFCMMALIGTCAITGAIAYCAIRRSLAKVQRLNLKERSRENIEILSNESLADQALKLSNLICVLITVFVICVLPFSLFVLLMESDVLIGFKYNYVLYLATSILLYGNCLANPLILMFMSKDARTALRVIEKKAISSPRRPVTEHIMLEA